MSKTKISILGCGWLGKALVQKLIVDYDVWCSVSSDASYGKLTHKQKVILNPQNNYIDSDFYHCDTLIIALPPKEDYLKNLEMILLNIRIKTQLILLSSTSVYTQSSGIVTEEMSAFVSQLSLMHQGELVIQTNFPSALILRLGGLMGYGRIAGKYSAGKRLYYNRFINYVHRDDVVKLIHLCIIKSIKNNTFNVVAPLHPTCKELYDYNAKRYQFSPTIFNDETKSGKIVSSSKVEKILDFSFKYCTIENICQSPV